MLLQILFYTFLAVVCIQFTYYIFLFGKFAFLLNSKTGKEDKKETKEITPVSIIIAARNEAENLKQFLPKVLNQNYTDFEIIIVNDSSTDKTEQVIKVFQKDYDNLKLVHIYGTGNKKNAITKGIEASSNDYLLFTDADCYPKSENWISEIVSHFNNDKQLILGYGAYQKINNSILNKLIRFETLLTAIQYFSYTKMGIPYMGVGRNLGYKKKLFVKSNGFNNHKHIKSGDDDLFINQAATSQNTEICFSKNSFTISKPKTSLSSWLQQKRRHISTANKYKPIHQFLLGLFYMSQLLFWLLAIILLIFSFNWQLVTIFIIIRLTAQYIIVHNSAIKLDEKDITIFTPFLDFLLVVTQFGLFISNLISKPKYW